MHINDYAQVCLMLYLLVSVRLPPAAEPPAPRPDGDLDPEVHKLYIKYIIKYVRTKDLSILVYKYYKLYVKA